VGWGTLCASRAARRNPCAPTGASAAWARGGALARRAHGIRQVTIALFLFVLACGLAVSIWNDGEGES
jgi:hypothetical protein